MKWYEAAGIGAVMGCLCGVVLWASVLTREAYYIALREIYVPTPDYGAVNTTPMTLEWNAPMIEPSRVHLLLTPDPNMVYMPYVVTGLVMLIAFTVLFSVPLWYPYAQITFDQLADNVISGWRDERDDDDEDDDE
jgi:hypothetical protein